MVGVLQSALRKEFLHLIQVRRNVTSRPRRKTTTADDAAALKGREEEEGGGGASRPDVNPHKFRIRIRPGVADKRAPNAGEIRATRPWSSRLCRPLVPFSI
ncbi:MAG: hypothetical protein Q8O19_05610, partial [Rectinemataceae bacterium]|nr:hypothetical protein [Rectinemataceae bacterium]